MYMIIGKLLLKWGIQEVKSNLFRCIPRIVGPLEDNAGNIITQELNMHFSLFTREDTSSLPVPETKFEGSEGERLGQLGVTPEIVANKINNMKENKSPGVDGIAPKILKETV